METIIQYILCAIALGVGGFIFYLLISISNGMEKLEKDAKARGEKFSVTIGLFGIDIKF